MALDADTATIARRGKLALVARMFDWTLHCVSDFNSERM
jgi:hypothetical protein